MWALPGVVGGTMEGGSTIGEKKLADSSSSSVRIFVSRNDRDLEAAEAALRGIGVPYEISLEGVPDLEEGSSVCYQRLVIRVDRAVEDRCRGTLAKAGLG